MTAAAVCRAGAAMPHRMVPAGEVAAMLAAQAGTIASELFPNGRVCGPEFRVGSLAGEPGQSLSICLRGAKAGVWCEFNGDAKGDMLDLVAGALFGGDKKSAYRWALQRLGLDRGDPAALEQARRQAQRAAAKAAKRDEPNRSGAALALWAEARELKPGDLVDLYLKGRGIDLAELGRCPRALRFYPACWCAEAQAPLPAMLGLVVNQDGRPMAVHRTWLQVHGAGRVTKAAVPNPKKSLGRLTGGAIRLWRGAGGAPFASAPWGSTVVVTEGIENALSIAIVAPERRVIAAVSLANIANLRLSGRFTDIVIFADNDGDNEAAARGLQRAIEALQCPTRRVWLARPPAEFKDANDVLRGIKRGAA